MRKHGKERGFFLAEAATAVVIISLVMTVAATLFLASGRLYKGAADDANLSSIAGAAGEALRLGGAYPPCGATEGATGTCAITAGALPEALAAKGYTVSARARAAAFDPSGRTGTTVAGDFYEIYGTVTSPSGRKEDFSVLAPKP